MKQVDRKTVAAMLVQELGLDPNLHPVDSAEVSAAILRRVAAFRCPCPPRTLIAEAVTCTHGLRPEAADDQESEYDTILNDLQAYGDLMSGFDRRSGKDVQLLYLGPLGFTRRPDGHVLLHGIAAEEPEVIPEALKPRLARVRHTRRFEIKDNEDPRALLGSFGFAEVPEELWLEVPALGDAQGYVSRLDSLLDAVSPRRSAFDMEVLLPSTSVRHYRSRWSVSPPPDGRFIGRRRRLYGASLWCYAEIKNRDLLRFLDLPVSVGVRRGCDEAWALQAAIDCCLGHPQRYRMRQQGDGETAFEVFGPVPSWVQRRWQAIGSPVSPGSGALLANAIPKAAAMQEAVFLERVLWMKEEGRADSH